MMNEMNYWDRKTIKSIRKGYFTACYFLRTQKILLSQNNWSLVTMQVFQKNDQSTLCGINEILSLLKVGCGLYKKGKWQNLVDKISVKGLQDGDTISAGEPVLHITGPYIAFAHLESLYLGILARRTLVATNSRRMITAASGKPVYFFADRFDHFFNQEGDGYAGHVGGISDVCTQAQAFHWNGHVVGTMPHSLIALYGGETTKAAKSFLQQFPQVPLVVLVDFQNDCVGTALEVARSLGDKLYGVRLDTSELLTDRSVKESGVCPVLVRLVRQALDWEGFYRVKIIVSGGFTAEKIKWFEAEKVPVDAYGVGSALLKGNNDFTADIVKVNGILCAKIGRAYQQNNRMKQLL